MKIKFGSDDELPLDKMIDIPTNVRTIFVENNKYYWQFFLVECLWKISMKSKKEIKETDRKNSVCYYFHDLINGTQIDFSNILLAKKLYGNFSLYNV